MNQYAGLAVVLEADLELGEQTRNVHAFRFGSTAGCVARLCLAMALPEKSFYASSRCNLCVLRASVVNELFEKSTTETQGQSPSP